MYDILIPEFFYIPFLLKSETSSFTIFFVLLNLDSILRSLSCVGGFILESLACLFERSEGSDFSILLGLNTEHCFHLLLWCVEPYLALLMLFSNCLAEL